MKGHDLQGAYTADRASALSGVPKSTIHYWDRTQLLVPSISPERIKLWSYPDLMGLRTIYWLRREKTADDGISIPATSMPTVRRALRGLRDLDLALWTEELGPSVAVDRSGHIYFDAAGQVSTLTGQRPLNRDLLDLIAPFETEVGVAPNLYAPRPSLRIVPGKLSGSPHIVKTRIETVAIAALEERGLTEAKIAKLYPMAPPVAIGEALDLEHQLQTHLRSAA
ncbi:MAG: DUF433 domain-containing protein [Solirubrobacteraceae bacterium]